MFWLSTLIKNRIVGQEEVNPEELLAHPFNWRVHPKEQQNPDEKHKEQAPKAEANPEEKPKEEAIKDEAKPQEEPKSENNSDKKD